MDNNKETKQLNDTYEYRQKMLGKLDKIIDSDGVDLETLSMANTILNSMDKQTLSVVNIKMKEQANETGNAQLDFAAALLREITRGNSNIQERIGSDMSLPNDLMPSTFVDGQLSDKAETLTLTDIIGESEDE